MTQYTERMKCGIKAAAGLLLLLAMLTGMTVQAAAEITEIKYEIFLVDDGMTQADITIGGVLTEEYNSDAGVGADESVAVTVTLNDEYASENGYSLEGVYVIRADNGKELDAEQYSDETGSITCTFTMPDCDVIVLSNVQEEASGTTPHMIDTVFDSEQGSVFATAISAEYGEQVIVVVIPEDGYELADDGLEISAEEQDVIEPEEIDSQDLYTAWRFSMPAEKVTVSITFSKSVTDDDSTDPQEIFEDSQEDSQEDSLEEDQGETASDSYRIIPASCDSAQGSVEVTYEQAGENNEVTVILSVTSEAGYKLEEIYVIRADNGGTLEVSESESDGTGSVTCTFTMPESDVLILADFQETGKSIVMLVTCIVIILLILLVLALLFLLLQALKREKAAKKARRASGRRESGRTTATGRTTAPSRQTMAVTGTAEPVVHRNRNFAGQPVRIVVTVLAGGGATQDRVLELRDELLIGSDPGCALVLQDPQVSSRNTRIFREGNAVMIQDLNENSVTSINGMRIFAKNRLHSGDEVTVGSIRFRFRF